LPRQKVVEVVSAPGTGTDHAQCLSSGNPFGLLMDHIRIRNTVAAPEMVILGALESQITKSSILMPSRPPADPGSFPCRRHKPSSWRSRSLFHPQNEDQLAICRQFDDRANLGEVVKGSYSLAVISFFTISAPPLRNKIAGTPRGADAADLCPRESPLNLSKPFLHSGNGITPGRNSWKQQARRPRQQSEFVVTEPTSMPDKLPLPFLHGLHFGCSCQFA